MTVLALSKVSKRFGPTVALDSVDLRLQKGEVHALIGENGAGKSTLMNLLAGLMQPDHGDMEIEEEPYAPANSHDAREKGIALIHQELSLFPHLPVAENIMMGKEPSRLGLINRAEMRVRTAEVLQSFHHPEIKPETPVGNLSIAARQIVEICRAIAARARFILMDEPTSSLQRDDVNHLFRLIRKFREQGITVIYISHFLEEVREIADNYTVLRDGRSVATGELKTVSDQQLIAHMVGRQVEDLFPRRTTGTEQHRETVLEVADLSSSRVLKGASFELKRGEIFGIAGLMGSGRTRLARTIFGLDPATGGSIKLKGKSFNAREGKPAVRLRQKIGYVSEDRKGEGLAVTLSVADNLTITRFNSCATAGWLSLTRQAGQAESLINSLSVKARDVRQPVSMLSGGNQQKVAIGRLLHQDADILLLNEPTRGVDIGSKAQIYKIIADCAQQGKAVLIISSYLPELFGMCDRLAVMSRGRLSPARPVQEWTPESVMQAAIGGEGN
jgi:ABC-type sugar transport system ATPase subunit